MDDTIAAIATAYGEGGIGIIRISGENSQDILERIFIAGSGADKGKGQGKKTPIINRRLTYGVVVDPETGKQLDEAMAVFMKAPHTYTMEDVAEIQCHGSIISLRNILALCLQQGARLAEPGEFTKRAFLNGRVDLSQAEAVIDLIKAKTDRSFDVALDQMAGKLSDEIRQIRSHLMELLVQVTVNLDYPDEDIEEISYDSMNKSLLIIGDKLDSLLRSATTGRMLREGLAVTIAGRPNVGKSSLMNAFLRESRAIVTEIPGTTRDTIEETLSIAGIPVRLTDTAGIRKTTDKIEQIGIEKSKDAVNKADLILFMLSGNERLTEEDLEIIPYLNPKKTIVLLNKRDLETVLTRKQVEETMPDFFIIETSVSQKKGLEILENRIQELVYGGKVSQADSMVVTNVRHAELIRKAREEITAAQTMTQKREALDFIEINIRQAFDYLGEIIGETANDQIINEVFSRFCLGK